jgi:hypothetical protein
MSANNYQREDTTSCGPEDPNFTAFIKVTSLIGGHDAVEEFLACGLWPLGQQFGFLVETKESPLSKVLVPMLQITATIGEWESEAQFVPRIEKAANELIGRYNLVEHKAYQGFSTCGSTIFSNWLEISASPGLSLLCGNANLLPRAWLRRWRKPLADADVARYLLVPWLRPHWGACSS